ncbi:MAG: hypothetical protein ACSLE9_07855 [Burkholderiaceae bacterium]
MPLRCSRPAVTVENDRHVCALHTAAAQAKRDARRDNACAEGRHKRYVNRAGMSLHCTVCGAL